MGLTDGMRAQDIAMLAAGVVGGVLLTMGIRKVMSKSANGSKARLKGRFKLYHTKTFRSSRVLWAIYELDLQSHFEILPYNPHICSDEEKAWYKEHLQPNGLIPAVVLPSGEVIYESSAVCLYLSRCANKLQPPEDEIHFFYSWSLYSVCTMEPFVQVLMEERYLTRESRKNRELQREKTAKLMESMDALEKHLATRNYICGNRFTIADIIVGYTLMFGHVMNGGQLFVDHPHVREYLERLQARPHFENTIGTHKEWLEKAEELRSYSATHFE